VFGTAGRESGQIRLRVGGCPNGAELLDFVNDSTLPDVTLNTDEWNGYSGVSGTGRERATVCHLPSRRVWARDDDGDGINEVHNNTIEGIWTGLRNTILHVELPVSQDQFVHGDRCPSILFAGGCPAFALEVFGDKSVVSLPTFIALEDAEMVILAVDGNDGAVSSFVESIGRFAF
jgi:hypothetical protein